MIASLLFVHANVRRYLLLEAARSCLEQIQVLVRGREAERANRVELFDVPQNAEYPKFFFFCIEGHHYVEESYKCPHTSYMVFAPSYRQLVVITMAIDDASMIIVWLLWGWRQTSVSLEE